MALLLKRLGNRRVVVADCCLKSKNRPRVLAVAQNAAILGTGKFAPPNVSLNQFDKRNTLEKNLILRSRVIAILILTL